MRETHRRTDYQKLDVPEHRAIVTNKNQNQKLDRRIKITKLQKEKIQMPKLRPKTTPTRKSNVQEASRQQRSKREKNNRQVPQARVFGDTVLQPPTRLKADTVQTASYIKRQILNFARRCKLAFASTRREEDRVRLSRQPSGHIAKWHARSRGGVTKRCAEPVQG